MAIFNAKAPAYKKRPEVISEWATFRKGLNLILRPTEISNEEMSEAYNIMLIGSGVPTGRWGTEVFFDTGGTYVNGLGFYRSSDLTIDDVLALSNTGYLVKKNNSSYTIISGNSWPTSTNIHTEQLGNRTYIVSPDVAFTEYDGTDLSVFATISPPTGVSATNFSGATGPERVSYRIVAIGPNGGQTTPSANYVLENVPVDLSKTQIHVFWTAPSAATLGGFEIYRGREGDETFLASTSAGVTKYVDNGEPASESILAPLTNTTGGVKARCIAKYKDRLLVVPEDDPTKLMISARYPYHTRFNALDGGGYIYIDPDSGDQIVGVEVQPIADRIVVYKTKSSYLVQLDTVSFGNYTLLDPQYAPISTAVGCSSQDTIAVVENDLFYFGRDGIYVTGYEPNFLNIIRTNEVSFRVKPYLDLLSQDDFDTACAVYFDKKYILSFPLRKEMLVYDRSRGCFVGIWRLPFGIRYMKKYVDIDGNEKLILGTDDGKVYNFNASINSDNGEIIEKRLKTNKTSFGDWTTMNTVGFFYFLFRNIVGTTNVTITLEDREGITSAIKTFTITGAEQAGKTGYGIDPYGTAEYGLSNYYDVSIASDEIMRWGTAFKTGKLMQVEVSSTESNSNFELLKIAVTAKKHSRGTLSSSLRV